ncbi:hypothetical protein CKO35_07665 [Ectothiorhodospira shaposhnikovii]|nr:hypothetical protein [Ectothiorhodospira shaposhnikovii]
MNQEQKHHLTVGKGVQEVYAEPASPLGGRLLSSTELLEGHRQLRIKHQGEIYTLRVTSKGKLILTK